MTASAHAQPPGPPLNVTATVNANSTLTIRWTPPQTGGPPTDYVVEMSLGTSDDGFFLRRIDKFVPGNVTTFTTGWLQDRWYSVRVRARNADGEAFSPSISVEVPCSVTIGATRAPANLSWRSLADNSLRLVWTYPWAEYDEFLSVRWYPWFRVEVGTAPGLADVDVLPFTLHMHTMLTLPSGTYRARVRPACHSLPEATGPTSEEITMASGAPSEASPVLINEVGSIFRELKNVSNVPVAIGEWKILGAALAGGGRVSEIGTVPPGTTLQPGCTYLLGPASGVAGVPVDATVRDFSLDAGLVTDRGQIVDGFATFVPIPFGSPLLLFGEGTALPHQVFGVYSHSRRGGQDTDNNAADFVYLSPPTPQNSSFPCTPSALTGSVNGNTVTLSWNAPPAGPAVTSYRLEAGSVPGAANLAVFDLTGSTPAVAFASVPNGTYFVRVHAVNAAGSSEPSDELTVVVCGAGCTVPGAVTSLTFAISGNDVLLTWRAPADGPAPTGYVIEAGTASGLSNLGQFATGGSAEFVIVPGVPPGTYYVRVRAVSGGTVGPPSNEVVITP